MKLIKQFINGIIILGKIKRLEKSLIDKIAAGEVIVRPASVVKELIENSIDAGSKHIRIEISNNNRDITIIDDGCGMEEDDLILLFERHCTSKIEDFDDLERLSTRGFRGEALASIAAVSKVEIISHPKDSLYGYRVQVEGGQEIKREKVGSAPGTSIYVRSLFFNTPARLKFLKSEISEMNAIMQTITSQAISQPEISITLISNGKIVFDLPAAQDLKDRIIKIFGGSLRDNLIEIKREGPPISVYGYISKPEVSRKDRLSEYFFVQKRPIINKTLNYTLEQAYSGLLMTKRFPVSFVFIDLAPGEVDVNVHPTKLEVRFRDEKLVASIVYHSALESLRSAFLIPEMKIELPPGSKDEFDQIIQSKTQQSVFDTSAGIKFPQKPDIFNSDDALLRRQFNLQSSSAGKEIDIPLSPTKYEGEQSIYTPLQESVSKLTHPKIHAEPFPPEFTSTPPQYIDSSEKILESLWNSDFDLEPIGQIADTYIAATFGEHLLLVDQHAAHERIIYLMLKQQENKGRRSQQPLLIPLTFDVKISDIPLLNSILPFLSELGFEIESFGGTTFAVQAMPADLEKIDSATVIQDILDDLNEQKGKSEVDLIRDRILTKTACNAAVKSGQSLSYEEMKKLLNDLRHTNLSFTCPHGRPTMILITKSQLDKQFKRTGLS